MRTVHAAGPIRAALAVLAAVAAGCGGEAGAGGEKTAAAESKTWVPVMENPPLRTVGAGAPKYVEDMADGDVIVAVNGVALTKADFDMRIRRYKWFLDRNRGMDPQQKTAMYRKYGRGLVNNFVSSAAVAWEARAKRVLDEATVRAEVEKSVDMTLKNNGISREFCDGNVPGGVKGIAESLEESLWCHAYMTNAIPPNPEIDSTLVSNIMAKIDAENAVIAASNAVIRARLEKARERIVKGGEAFGKVADEVCEDVQMVKDGTGYYGKFGEETIQDANVRRALFALGQGETSEIIEEDDGYSIYKILSTAGPVFKNGAKVEDAKVEVARIWVSKEESVVTAFSGDPVEDLRRQDFAERSAKLAKELRAKAVVEYPHGTNFWKQGRAKRKK